MSKLAEKSASRPIALTGLRSVEMICPCCGSPYWGSSGAWGTCNGSQYGFGPCKFKWPRELDWMYFRRRSDGGKFLTPDAFDRAIGPDQERGVA